MATTVIAIETECARTHAREIPVVRVFLKNTFELELPFHVCARWRGREECDVADRAFVRGRIPSRFANIEGLKVYCDVIKL